MSLNRIIVIFGIALLIFAAIVFYQFSTKSPNSLDTLPSKKVTIGNQVFTVGVATTSAQQQIGLTGSASLPQNEGMLFVFDTPDYYNFWTKNMKFPIDIIFIKDGKIISINEDAKPVSQNMAPEYYQPENPVDEVLEINSGLIKKYNIKKGDNVSIQ